MFNKPLYHGETVFKDTFIFLYFKKGISIYIRNTSIPYF